MSINVQLISWRAVQFRSSNIHEQRQDTLAVSLTSSLKSSYEWNAQRKMFMAPNSYKNALLTRNVLQFLTLKNAMINISSVGSILYQCQLVICLDNGSSGNIFLQWFRLRMTIFCKIGYFIIWIEPQDFSYLQKKIWCAFGCCMKRRLGFLFYFQCME